ncbi:hypothetical protein OSTOST_24226 [Ostertagia ostertagi]
MPVTMEPFGRQQQLQGTSTTTHRPEESKVDRYTQFLFLLVSSILTLAALMCVARIIFVYCSYKDAMEDFFMHDYHWRQQDERHRRTQTRTVTVEAELNHGFNFAADGGGVTNYGFTDPPPRYDQLFKREEPPPLYASVRNSQIITSPRQSTESALREDETHSLPTYEQEFNRRSPSMRSGSTSTAISVLSGNTPLSLRTMLPLIKWTSML